MRDKTFPRRMTYFCSFGMIACLIIAMAVQYHENPAVGQLAEPFTVSVVPDVGAAEPQFNSIERVRYIMSLIRGEFDETTGVLVLISAIDANAWIESLYRVQGPIYFPEGHEFAGQPIPWDQLTTEQKARFYLRRQRQWHVDYRKASDVPKALAEAKIQAEIDVATVASIFPEISE